MPYQMVEITEDRIPGTPKEQMFLALAEGATVLALGTIPGPGCLAEAVGIYRQKDGDMGYQGWLFISGHSDKKMNGLFYHEYADSDFVKRYPYFVSFVAFAEGLAEPDKSRDVVATIALTLMPAPPKGKMN